MNERQINLQTSQYWERNAPLTLAVLLFVIIVSAFDHPIEWRLILGASVGGVLMFVGMEISDKAPRVRIVVASIEQPRGRR